MNGLEFYGVVVPEGLFLSLDALFYFGGNIVLVWVYLDSLFCHHGVDAKMNIPCDILSNIINVTVPIKDIPVCGQETAT